jgi:hypothetical protein
MNKCTNKYKYKKELRKMNGNKKFKEIYDKFGGNYGELIEEHLRVLKELEKCRKALRQQTRKIEKR